MNNNMISFFMNLINSGGNPQYAIMNILQKQSKENPMMANLFQLSQQKDYNGLENIARNLCKQKGLDFDSEFEKFKQQIKGGNRHV